MEKDVFIKGVFNLVTSDVCWRKQQLWEVTDQVKLAQVQQLFSQDQGLWNQRLGQSRGTALRGQRLRVGPGRHRLFCWEKQHVGAPSRPV